jgi:hypothetical protein
MINLIRLLSAPFRKILKFPLVQLTIVFLLVLAMQTADDGTALGEAFNALDKLVVSSVSAVAAHLSMKSLTMSFLMVGVTIAYVYVAFWLILSLVRIVIKLTIDLVGRKNIFWLRSAIARERGMSAYRAWLPLERIRPADISQHIWEEKYAWPRNNLPPYPPLIRRIARATFVYLLLLLLAGVLLQVFTRWPVLSWLVEIVWKTIDL